MAVEARQLGLLEEVDLTKLEIHPRNPRTDVGDITELAASIAQIGVLEPIVGIRHNGKIQAVTGSRRLAAAKKAGLKQIPVRIMEMADADAAAAALIENLQRKDLEPLEEAEAFRNWLTLTGKTQVELAKAISKAPSTIANALRLLEAPKVLQDALRAKRLTPAGARVALSLPAEAIPMLDLSDAVTVQDLEDDVRQTKRAFQLFERVRSTVDKAKKNGDDVTWPAGAIYVQGSPLDLGKLLGKPPKAIAGEILGWLSLPGVYGSSGSIAIHDKACECRTLGVTNNEKFLQRVCVSPSGYKKYKAALVKGRQTRTGTVKKRVVTAATKEAKRKADLKVNAAEAKKALAGKAMGYGALKLEDATQFVFVHKGDEPQRIALFGLVSKASHAARGNAWRVELWRQIAALPMKDVRQRVLQWGIALGQREISDDYKNNRAIRKLVNEHYGPAKKKAKR